MATRWSFWSCLCGGALFACGGPPLALLEDVEKQPDHSAGAGGEGGISGAGGNGGGGPAGTAGAAPFACPADTDAFYAAPVDTVNGCLDTSAVVVAGCGRPLEQTGARCLRRLSDGARYWSMLAGVPLYDPALWEPCTNGLGAPEQAPPVCALRTCAVAPAAFCAPERIVEIFACGAPQSEWDDGCCQRAACESNVDCAADLACRPLAVRTRTCWPRGDASACACAEEPTTREEKRCAPALPE